MDDQHGQPPSSIARTGEVARSFLVLGLTAFGGPVAHLAHFRRELVERRRWINEDAYAELVAYCQFLPGPTSSQVGFLLGWQRAGLPGALAAWSAFTLPSAVALATAAIAFGHLDPGGAWLAGMKAAVLAVVAQAVLGMCRSLCPDAPRTSIAAGVAMVALLAARPWMSVLALLPAGLAGILLLRGVATDPGPGAEQVPSRTLSLTCLLLLAFATALALPGITLVPEPWGALYAIPYQAGALVFGGGHVVLPLLHDPLVQRGLVGDQAFLVGYGAAQAVPGPLFTLAAWTGALVAGIPGACLALVAIFLPGLLLALGCLRFYRGSLTSPLTRRAVMGLNAGVVGLLGAALWNPIGQEAITGPASIALALLAFTALEAWRVPAWAVVAGCCALASIHAAMF
ncbi:MAG: chromate efflux transporter [Planctomycetes bacterium]|nr:chromate efflux transporter [Planctomycetota bacterium]